MTTSTLDALGSLVRARASGDGIRWFDGTTAAVREERDLATLLRSYTAAPRHVGRLPLAATADETRRFADIVTGFSFVQWTIDDAARAALLQAAAAGEPDPNHFYELATACYEQGDSREQQSWLRGVALLPDAPRFTLTAVDACRTNIQPLFESIACENPFPAQCFPDGNFNQLVLKAMFNHIALARIVNLPSRLNRELARMAADYASEREAAGRSIPGDISLVLRVPR